MKLVFVSSTFRDMQFERDALNTRVVPRINHFLERYSETVHFGDLRWGVNTTELESEESSKKVLKACLDQIDDCKPYKSLCFTDTNSVICKLKEIDIYEGHRYCTPC